MATPSIGAPPLLCDACGKIAELEARLAEANETLDAIRTGAVDALVVRGPVREAVYTLRGADEPYRLLVEAMNEGAAILDGAGGVLHSNAKLAAMLGAPQERVLGVPLAGLVSPAEGERLAAFLDAGRADGAQLEIRLGSGVAALFSVRPLGVRDQLCLVATDISERKRQEETLAQQAAELMRSNTDLEQFAYVASHDLRSPLRAMENLARWIEEDAGHLLPDESRAHLEALRCRVHRMDRLLEDLLRYARAGRPGAEPEDIALRPFLEEVIELAESRGAFRFEIDCGVASLRAVRAPLEQVLRNLVCNAVKHHDRGHGTIEIATADRGDFVEFSVADDGPGIPDDCHERAFRMFQTLRPRDAVEGSGMGLALVKKLVESNEGAISIAPSAGRGARFVFTWPKRVD